MFENRDCVGILPKKNISNDWLSFGNTILGIYKHCNTFEVVFPTLDGKVRDDAIVVVFSLLWR
jgi:hypothetical protein